MNKSKPEQLRLKLKTNSSKIIPHKPPNQKFTEEARILGKKKKTSSIQANNTNKNAMNTKIERKNTN